MESVQIDSSIHSFGMDDCTIEMAQTTHWHDHGLYIDDTFRQLTKYIHNMGPIEIAGRMSPLFMSPFRQVKL